MKPIVWILLIVIIASVGALVLKPEPVAAAGELTIYKSASCGCCGSYGSYLMSKGWKVNVIDVPDVNVYKQQYGVPTTLYSCHTTMVGEYFVEGHVPVEAISKLMQEQPDIAGIGLAAMPSGTPGMPGPKTGPWAISAVGKDGRVSTFMTI